MASRKSRSNGRSVSRADNRLAAFAAHVEAVASGQMAATDAVLPALELALNKRKVMQCSTHWKTFAQQVAAADHQHAASRVLFPSQALPPLP